MAPLEQKWKTLSFDVRRDAIDALTHFLVELGSEGTVHDERVFGSAGDPADPLPPEDEVAHLVAYFPVDSDTAAIEAEIRGALPVLDGAFGPDSASIGAWETVTDDGWSEKWKEHFKPRRVGRRLVVKPTWEEFDATPDDVLILVDPGQAFGTGGHETTTLCMRAIESLFDGGITPKHVLDVGTGTGILAITSLRLGAYEALGIDTDPLSVEAATQNAETNGVADKFRVEGTPLVKVTGVFDLVVANIIAEALVDMKEALVVRVAPCGHLLLSGILGEKGSWVEGEFAEAGATLVRRDDDGAWCSLLFSLPPSAA